MEFSAIHRALGVKRLRDLRSQAVLGDFGLLLSLSVALLVILPLIQRVHVAEYDEAVLLDTARNVMRTGLPVRSIGLNGIPLLDHTPLYPLLLSTYAPATGDSLFFARGATVVVGLLCIVLTYRIGIVIGGKGVGFLAALFVALNPFLAVYSYFVRMEMFMVAPILLAIYLLVRRPSHSLAELLFVGFVLAIGCLFKEFAIVVTGPAAVYVWLTRQASIGRRSLEALTVFAPSILAIGAWGLWVSQTWPHAFVPAVQRWLHSAAGGNLNDPRMFIGWIEWSRQLVEDLFRPGLVLALLGALVAKVLLPKTEHGAEEALLWGYLVAALTFSSMMKLREPRHLIALVPIAAILAAQGLMSLSQVVRRAPPFARVGTAVLIVTLLVFSTPWQPASVFAGSQGKEILTATYRTRLDGNDRFYGPLAQTGAEVQRLSEPEEVIVVAHQGPVIAYYADRHYLMLYTLNEQAILQALGQARLLIWDTPTWLALPPGRAPFVEARVAADFDLLPNVGDNPEAIKIYQRKP